MADVDKEFTPGSKTVFDEEMLGKDSQLGRDVQGGIRLFEQVKQSLVNTKDKHQAAAREDIVADALVVAETLCLVEKRLALFVVKQLKRNEGKSSGAEHDIDRIIAILKPIKLSLCLFEVGSHGQLSVHRVLYRSVIMTRECGYKTKSIHTEADG